MYQINLSEFTEAVRKYQLSSPSNPIAAESAWEKVLAYLSDSKASETVMGMFKRMDRDGDKCLTLEELSRGLADLGVPMSASEVRAFIKALDTNGDGITQTIIRIHVHRAEAFMWEAARDLERTYAAHCGGRND